MGATLSTEQLEDIEKRTHFNRKEIARMHKRFMAMDVDKKGYVPPPPALCFCNNLNMYITVQQFTLLPELCCNPLVDLIAASFDGNKVRVFHPLLVWLTCYPGQQD